MNTNPKTMDELKALMAEFILRDRYSGLPGGEPELVLMASKERIASISDSIWEKAGDNVFIVSQDDVSTKEPDSKPPIGRFSGFTAPGFARVTFKETDAIERLIRSDGRLLCILTQ